MLICQSWTMIMHLLNKSLHLYLRLCSNICERANETSTWDSTIMPSDNRLISFTLNNVWSHMKYLTTFSSVLSGSSNTKKKKLCQIVVCQGVSWGCQKKCVMLWIHPTNCPCRLQKLSVAKLEKSLDAGHNVIL